MEALTKIEIAAVLAAAKAVVPGGPNFEMHPLNTAAKKLETNLKNLKSNKS